MLQINIYKNVCMYQGIWECFHCFIQKSDKIKLVLEQNFTKLALINSIFPTNS